MDFRPRLSGLASLALQTGSALSEAHIQHVLVPEKNRNRSCTHESLFPSLIY